MRPITMILQCAALLIASTAGRVAGQNSKNATGVANTNAMKASAGVCALLTAAEIEAIQGERVAETKATARPGGGLLTSQCMFRTSSLSKSVSVSLTTSDPAHPPTPVARQLWQKQFHPVETESEEESTAGEKGKKLEPERERESGKPRVVRGLGEEAFWVAGPVASALYVLRGDMFLRISVGSAGQEDERMEKSESLARTAIKRLRAVE